MEINWTSILPIIISAVGGCAMAWLGLYIKDKISATAVQLEGKINTTEDKILNHIDNKFALKELMDKEMTFQKENFKKLETTVNTLLSEMKQRMDRLESRNKDGN